MQPFFTLPNPALISESSIDPLGLQAVWTSYAHKIFNNRLTTVANDIRIFTIDIFHHHVIHRILTEEPELVANALKKYRSWEQKRSNLVTGILIFIEDMATVSFLGERGKDINPVGILGLYKAMEREGGIVFNAYKNAGLLKNQLNLGMTGRYKGPMMKMGFFNRQFEYQPEMANVALELEQWTALKELEEKLKKFIREVVLVADGRTFPSVRFSQDMPQWRAVKRGYLECFGTNEMKAGMKSFWKGMLGLNSGAAKAVYEASGENLEESSLSQIFFAAIKKTKEEEEKKKIDEILRIEPVLSHAEYIARRLADPGTKSLNEVMPDLILIRKKLIELKPSLPDHIGNTVLQELLKVIYSETDDRTWILGIAEYHKKIMEVRGGHAWFSIDATGDIKKLFTPALSNNLKTAKEYLKSNHWFHHYYVGTLKGFYQSLN